MAPNYRSMSPPRSYIQIMPIGIGNRNDRSQHETACSFFQMNLTKYLCESPNAARSSLSKNALRLLHSGQLTDMEFEVIGSGVTAPTTNDSTTEPIMADANELDSKVHTFRAHRVIVGSRCEWFNKALSSGMQESINRLVWAIEWFLLSLLLLPPIFHSVILIEKSLCPTRRLWYFADYSCTFMERLLIRPLVLRIFAS